MFSMTYIVGSVYIPPPNNSQVLQKIVMFVAEHPGIPVLLTGDFNNVCNPSIDRHPVGTGSETPFSRQLQELGFYDLWRLFNPLIMAYSCCSSIYKSLSRIDLAVGTELMLPLISDIQYLARGISDHSPILLSINKIKPCINPNWRINAYWLRVLPQGNYIHRALTDSFFL